MVQPTYGLTVDMEPAWAPDGSQIAFAMAQAGHAEDCM